MRKRRLIGKVVEETGIVEGKEFHHLVNVLRGKEGQEFILVTKTGKTYEAVIDTIDRKRKIVLARLRKLLENKDTSEAGEVLVAFALFSENRLKFLLEKCTEIGVAGFLPFIATRSKRTSSGIREGWVKVIESAVKQSGRASFPFIESVVDLETVVEKADNLGDVYLLDENGVELNSIILKKGKQIIFVGPEGGFTEEEKELILKKARGMIGLGNNVLRTETAAIVGSYEFLNTLKNKRR